jgi:hypothetical protein
MTGHQIVATNQTVFSLCGLCALALGAVRLGAAATVVAARSSASPDDALSHQIHGRN